MGFVKKALSSIMGGGVQTVEVPATSDAEVQTAADRAQARAVGAKGRSSTVLTSTDSTLSQTKKTTLGGK